MMSSQKNDGFSKTPNSSKEKKNIWDKKCTLSKTIDKSEIADFPQLNEPVEVL